MSQQGFDNFKQRIKNWMDSHPDEYDCFEEEMNDKDNVGYQKILSLAFRLVPQYHKIIRKKANQGVYEDISDIEEIFSESKLAESLINEFEKTPGNSIVPSMLSWLYFGKSFERMVERGEELRKNPDAGYLQKLLIASTNKILISKSISLGSRTKADWEEHNRFMKLADSDGVIDWALNDEKKKVGRKSDTRTLPEMLSETTVNKPEDLIQCIGEFLIGKKQYDIACLIIALEELRYIYNCDITAFRNALNNQYEGKIIEARGIQKAYSNLTDLLEDGTLIKNQTVHRNYIDKIKKTLSG